ncbi:DUF3558 domain-containing protein [Streptomyces paludis]|uniref:DUF3558 domain-containing protein n=1 Tax=Streptomyces paludis TaxID=2282738 RepID=A0A345HP35_9ACTN|nr:DUF3558 domain-containing protein [Streptomyces paludis]AXG78459.1 DUF3558 domain-containing protein [Streptomyces paludis]
MQPKARHAYLPGLAALLVVAVTGCSGGGQGGGSASDSKPGGPTTVTAAQPGKYRTLREACGTVPRATLKELLPGAASLPDTQQAKAYRGTPSLTYDTDRRVGCSWKADSADASHQLAIDLERVVSYDPTVSDADRAREVYEKQQLAAGLPVTDTSADTSADPDTVPDADADTDASAKAGKTPQIDSASGSPTASTSASGLEPRTLDSLGDAAFLNDVLAHSGSAAQRRTVSVVFRTSNVIVTVRYTEQSARSTEIPDSAELQDKARSLAGKLRDQLND